MTNCRHTTVVTKDSQITTIIRGKRNPSTCRKMSSLDERSKAVEDEIKAVEIKIKAVEIKIKAVEIKIKAVELELVGPDPDRAYLRKKEEHLRDEKKQLRDEKKQLRDEKIILLRRQDASGININSVSYQKNEKNLTLPIPLVISPSIHQ
jgi:chromosome segregation ATPase